MPLKGRKCFVKADFCCCPGGHRCNGGHIDLFGGHVDFVCMFEDGFVCRVSELHATDVGFYIDGQLDLPDGLDRASTTTVLQFDGFFADIVDNLTAQLGGKTCHRSGECSTI